MSSFHNLFLSSCKDISFILIGADPSDQTEGKLCNFQCLHHLVAENWSGKLKNLGKAYFLQLAATAVRNVNQMRDENGESYARKAMRLCGLALDNDGNWSTGMLNAKLLQEIINKYPDHFNGRLDE